MENMKTVKEAINERISQLREQQSTEVNKALAANNANKVYHVANNYNKVIKQLEARRDAKVLGESEIVDAIADEKAASEKKVAKLEAELVAVREGKRTQDLETLLNMQPEKVK